MNYYIKELLNNPLLLKTRKPGNGNTVLLDTIQTANIKLLEDILNSELIDLCIKDKNSANQNVLFYSIESKRESSFRVLYNFLKQNRPELVDEFINSSNNESQNLIFSTMKNFDLIKHATSKQEAYEILQYMIDSTDSETIKNYSNKKYGKLVHYFFYSFKMPSNYYYDEEDKQLTQMHMNIFKTLLDKGENYNEPSPIRENYSNDLMITHAFFNEKKDFLNILLNYPFDLEYKNNENKTLIESIEPFDQTYAQKILSIHEKRMLENGISVLDTKKNKIKI